MYIDSTRVGLSLKPGYKGYHDYQGSQGYIEGMYVFEL